MGNSYQKNTYVAECLEDGKSRGVHAIQFIPAGTTVFQYGYGSSITQIQKDNAERQHHSDSWFRLANNSYIDGTGTLGELIKHACGKHPECPANVKIHCVYDTPHPDDQYNHEWGERERQILGSLNSRHSNR